MRLLKWIFNTIVTLILLLIVIFLFLLSPTGLKTAGYVATKLVPGHLTYQELRGDITGPIYIKGFSYENAGDRITFDSLSFDWKPLALFHKKLVITRFNVNDLTVLTAKHDSLPAKESVNKESIQQSITHFLKKIKAIKLKPLTLPLSVKIKNFYISSIKLGHPEEAISTIIKGVSINGTLYPNDIHMIAKAQLIKPQPLLIKLSVEGNLRHYTAHIIAGNKDYDFLMNITGNQDAALITIPMAHAFNGLVEGRLAINWYPKIKWRINLKLNHLDLRVFDASLPKSISIFIETHGYIEHANPLFTLELNAQADKATLHLKLSHHKFYDGKWTISIPHIKELYPDARGALLSQGTLEGKLTTPTTTGTLVGSKIQFRTIALDKVNANWHIDFSHSVPSNLTLLMTQFDYGNYKINHIMLNLNGNLVTKKLHVKLTVGKPAVVFSAHAQYSASAWHGVITRFGTQVDYLGSFALQRPTQFSYATTQAYLKPMCLRANTGAFLCLDAKWQKDKPWHFNLSTSHFNFKELAKDLQTPTQFSGTLSVLAHAEGVGKQIDKASIKMTLSPGILTNQVDNDYINTAIRKSTINAIINQKVGLKADIHFNFAQHDKLDIKAHIPQFTDYTIPLKSKKLQARIHILMHDFRFVSIFESTVQVPYGKLNGYFTLDGTVGDPKFKGNASLHFPAFEYTTVDVQAHNLNAQLHVDGKKLTYSLIGYAYNNAPLYFSGDTFLSSPYAITHFYVHADNAEAIKTNQMDAFVNTSLKFLLTHTQLDIVGNLLVPKATIALVDFGGVTLMPVNQVTYSGLPKHIVPETSRKKLLDLKLGLGDQVVFSAYGLNVNLKGGLVLSILPEKGMVANGQVRIVKGGFNAYGQDLKIASGSSVSFSNSSVTDPYINARAYKNVTASRQSTGLQLNENNITVGLQIHGSIEDMQFTLYSDPPGLPQADILSYLVLGMAANNSNAATLSLLFNTAYGAFMPTDHSANLSGLKKFLNNTNINMRNQTILDIVGNPVQAQSSFIVGNQLTEKLYVEYSLGLLIPESIFSMHYRLSKNWSILTQAGNGYNVGVGADVLYSIEK